MKKIMLIYPPGEAYQRGEDRCQINVNASIANSLRACNDLGYAAAILQKAGYDVFLKDYQAEKLLLIDLINDINNYKPDVIFISTTNGSIFSDLKILNSIKETKKDTIIILKGAVFFNTEPDLFDEIDLSQTDYLIGGETEFIILPLINACFNDKKALKNIEGICYKDDNNKWQINKVYKFNDNLDEIPFPDRSLMKNNLYINPAVNKPMATITPSRGCPSSCIYCLSPLISGRKVRFRSAENIFEEIDECVKKYGITDFFFKADTFTINKDNVIKLCNLIINSDLKGKISWAANSRVNTIDEEMIIKMKEAGCYLIALGIESGSEESLIKMKKGITVNESVEAVKLIKKHKIQIFGFYLIGFPWESKKHLEETKKLIFKLDTDFIELSIAAPFKGSMLYDMVYKNLHNGRDILGKDSFKYVTEGTDFLSKEELEEFRKRVILFYHLRPKYIFKKIFNKKLTLNLILNYIKYGIRLIKNTLN